MNDHDLRRGALQRDPAACRALIERLTPIIRRRVALVLQRNAAKRARPPTRSDVLDLTQDVFVLLFDRDGRVLRGWDPNKGLSLSNFVGLVAEREAGAMLRSGRRSGWAEQLSDGQTLEPTSPSTSHPESQASARQQLRVLLDTLRERLSPRAFAMFEALYVDQRTIEDVAEQFATTPNALYTFRSRLRRDLEGIQCELAGSSSRALGGVT